MVLVVTVRAEPESQAGDAPSATWWAPAEDAPSAVRRVSGGIMPSCMGGVREERWLHAGITGWRWLV